MFLTGTPVCMYSTIPLFILSSFPFPCCPPFQFPSHVPNSNFKCAHCTIPGPLVAGQYTFPKAAFLWARPNVVAELIKPAGKCPLTEMLASKSASISEFLFQKIFWNAGIYIIRYLGVQNPSLSTYLFLI